MDEIKPGTRVVGEWCGNRYKGTYVGRSGSGHHIERHGGATWYVDGVSIEAIYNGASGSRGSSSGTTNKSTMDTIKEKFVLALTKEPQKSFRKAGITNGDDLLTTDGQSIFLSWLLHSKYADEFKKEVVDGLLEEKEDCK